MISRGLAKAADKLRDIDHAIKTREQNTLLSSVDDTKNYRGRQIGNAIFDYKPTGTFSRIVTLAACDILYETQADVGLTYDHIFPRQKCGETFVGWCERHELTNEDICDFIKMYSLSTRCSGNENTKFLKKHQNGLKNINDWFIPYQKCEILLFFIPFDIKQPWKEIKINHTENLKPIDYTFAQKIVEEFKNI